MTKRVLFVQGAGEGTHGQWDNKLVRSLKRELGTEYSVAYPRMPNEADPRYSAWKAVLLDAFDQLDNGSVLIGHSIGGTVLIHVLAEVRLKFAPDVLILIAPPFIGNGGWPSEDIRPRTDLADRLPPGMPVFLFHGTEDQMVRFTHALLYAKAIPHAILRVLSHRDHQLNNDLGEVARDVLSLSSQR